MRFWTIFAYLMAFLAFVNLILLFIRIYQGQADMNDIIISLLVVALGFKIAADNLERSERR